MTQAPFDIEKAHRWFAVELNNVAWELVEAVHLTADDAERMIHAAHASCFHWLQVGTALNHQRAQCLLATVYAKQGLAEAAVRHAAKCRELSQQVGDEQTTFDRACSYGCSLQAYTCAGQSVEAAEMRQKALDAARTLDPDDNAVFARLYLHS